MIDRLQFSKTGHFYKRSHRLSKSAIETAFKAVRLSVTAPSRYLFNHVHEEFRGALWSAISFFHEREPSFLELPANHDRERVCGFILLIEYRQHVAVYKSGLDLPSDFRSKYLQPAGSEKIEAATARASATFEQIRLRNMTASRHAMRSKTLEADDLRSVVSPSGSSRYAPSGFRTREANVHYTATPRTGRIATRSERVGHEELVNWSIEVIDRLTEAKVQLSSFIRSFARPLDLGAIPSDVHATWIAVDIPALLEKLFEEPPGIRLVRRHNDAWVELNKDEIEGLLAALERTFEVRKVRAELRIIDPRDGAHIGEIRIGKTRISLRRFDVPEATGVFAQRQNPGETGSAPESLKRYIDQNDLFTVLFNQIDVVYLEGSLYRDPSLAEGGETFLGYLRADDRLDVTTSEKGQFSPAHTAFDAESVFRAVIESSSTHEALACDDLGDEWADFIGIDAETQPKTVTFYHAKHGDPSLSASAFHASVGQAIKNLQHLYLRPEAVETKRAKWHSTYNSGGHATQIPRMTKATFVEFLDKVRLTTLSPDTIRRVHIVTDSLSRQEVVETLAAAKNGVQPPAHFVQLYSLLMGFFSACKEVNAFPAVICRP